VSSISAYAENDVENADETSKLATMPDPTVETFGNNYEFYGALKVLCEQAAEKACPGRTTIIRPGYIVGPGDPTDRFTWWPLRVARGGEMLVPGNPDDPMQIIDVRDLSAFMVRVAERKALGAFNACGPEKRLTTADVLAASTQVTKASTTFTYVPTSFLAKQGVNLEEMWPIWAPYEGKTKGFHTCSNKRAVAAGLTFTAVDKTIADLLEWFRSLPPERQATLKADVPADKEAELLAAWKAAKG
jgi:2'-hydroxyisoflavone reductase